MNGTVMPGWEPERMEKVKSCLNFTKILMKKTV